MSENNIYSAPVWNETTKEYIGWLDLMDIITFIVKIIKETTEGKDDLKDIDFYSLLKQDAKFALEHADAISGLK